MAEAKKSNKVFLFTMFGIVAFILAVFMYAHYMKTKGTAGGFLSTGNNTTSNGGYKNTTQGQTTGDKVADFFKGLFSGGGGSSGGGGGSNPFSGLFGGGGNSNGNNSNGGYDSNYSGNSVFSDGSYIQGNTYYDINGNVAGTVDSKGDIYAANGSWLGNQDAGPDGLPSGDGQIYNEGSINPDYSDWNDEDDDEWYDEGEGGTAYTGGEEDDPDYEDEDWGDYDYA